MLLHIISVVFRPLGNARACRHLRQQGLERARFAQKVQPRKHTPAPQPIAYIRKEDLVKLLPKALGGNIPHAGNVGSRGSKRAPFHGKSELRSKARHAQDAQAIVA